uniref:NADH-ubiquinone oxidoreductase chain 6 n=1 Tax=Allantus togatus TaxID=1384743 RepID=A0A895KVF2_9HYME|nr:NADH dehydrogenase subunit 6 [Allantus togatus]QRZ60647.1 NADH dehydrogenase subunit 6 [Allantus togatus]
MIKFFMMFLFLNSTLFMMMKTPLSMGLILLIQTMNISMISGIMSFNFWYSYIIFLIMLGGMLILFIYVSSLSSNQKFYFNKKIIFISIFMMMILMLMIMNSKYFNHNNLDLMNFSTMEIENNFLLKMSLNKLYNKPTNQIMILLINYLLLTLFIVVKITNINLGPLRKKN